MQESIGDSNRILSEHKDNSFIRSPLANKSTYDQRVFFTETKLPFKNSTNNVPCYTDYKVNQGQKHNIENMNQSFIKPKGENTGTSLKSGVVNTKDFQYGDRFIPCRFGNNTYETRFLNDNGANMQLGGGIGIGGFYSQSTLNPETTEVFNNNITNTQSPNSSISQ